MTEDQTLYLGIIMAKWYAGADSVMNDRRKTTVLYALETRKPESVNELAPTFPPTALKFQTYEYIAPGHSVPDEGLEKGGGNMLLYLQMTEHKEFPKEAIINYSGNYVSSGMDATICIAREIFWDSYLLRRTTAPLLNVLNPYTYVWVSGTDLSKPIAPHWSLGMADPCHQVESTYYWEPSPDDPLGWKWEPKNVEQHVNLRNDKGGESCDVKIECELF